MALKLALMAAPHLYIATPAYGGQVTIEYLHAVVALQAACEARGLGCHVELLEDDRIIPRARARLAARFLAHPAATHLLFIDADIGFAPQNAFRLLAADKDMAAGVYPIKHLDWERIRAAALAGAADLQAASLSYVVRFIPHPQNAIEVEGGLAKVAYAGTGFLLIRREVVRRVAQAHPELTAELEEEPGRTVMVFEPMIEPETGEYLSEDYAFCRRWRDLGGEVWADVESRLTHVGHATYSGALVQALKPG
ncbi:hypothetical protein [Phenylobacterium sp.]|uniref:hypothetical protein n=1 Tax=Phenylobacterium sp. TaxID=1871053 RepID=UPI002DEE8858|nr:hypothetical protein [Phenylobacterium sp.]